MSNDLTHTVSIAAPPDRVFDAINDVRGWWSGTVEGSTAGLGSEFTYEVADVHFSRFRITEFVPGRRVAWHVLDSFLSFTADQQEWTGTTVIFDVEPSDAGTDLRFTHHGLGSQHECFEVCEQAWAQYVGGSLAELASQGVGAPNSFEGQDALDAVGGRASV